MTDEINTTADSNMETIVHESIFDELIETYCTSNNIDDMRTADQNIWNSCLRYIYKCVFKNSDVLKSKELKQTTGAVTDTNYNAYNYDAVLELLDIYIYDLCMKYSKEVSIVGFSTLTGIHRDTINEWGKGSTKLSKTSFDIYKNLNDFNEESLSNLMKKAKNPVGFIAILNRRHGWASPYTGDSNRQKTALTAADLKQMRLQQLSEKGTQLPELDG